MAISIEDVYSVANRLSESGQQPTLAAVRSALGGGSFTTISEAMKSWRAMQQAAATPVREAAPAAVMERFNQLGADVWAVAINMANDRLAKEREAFESTKADMEQAHKEAADLADQMATELESTRKQLEQQGVLSRNRRKFRQPINVACPAPGRWGRPNSRVTSRHFDHGNASRTSRPDCSGLDEAD